MLFNMSLRAGRSDSRVVGTTRSETRIENPVPPRILTGFVFNTTFLMLIEI